MSQASGFVYAIPQVHFISKFLDKNTAAHIHKNDYEKIEYSYVPYL